MPDLGRGLCEITMELSWIPHGFAYKHLSRTEPEHKMTLYTSHKGWHHLDCKNDKSKVTLRDDSLV